MATLRADAWSPFPAAVGRRAGFALEASTTFPMTLTPTSLGKQVAYAKRTAAKIADADLRAAFRARASALDAAVAAWDGAHKRGRNYAAVVRRDPGN